MGSEMNLSERHKMAIRIVNKVDPSAAIGGSLGLVIDKKIKPRKIGDLDFEVNDLDSLIDYFPDTDEADDEYDADHFRTTLFGVKICFFNGDPSEGFEKDLFGIKGLRIANSKVAIDAKIEYVINYSLVEMQGKKLSKVATASREKHISDLKEILGENYSDTFLTKLAEMAEKKLAK